MGKEVVLMVVFILLCGLFNSKAFKPNNKSHCMMAQDENFTGDAGGNHLPGFMANTKEYITHKDRERIWKKMISLEKKNAI